MTSFWKRFCKNVGAVFGLAIFAVVLVLALFGPFIAPGNPWDMAGPPVSPPLGGEGFVLGTDMLGRDVWSTIVHGARVSLVIGAVSTAAALLIEKKIGCLPVVDAEQRIVGILTETDFLNVAFQALSNVPLRGRTPPA